MWLAGDDEYKYQGDAAPVRVFPPPAEADAGAKAISPSKADATNSCKTGDIGIFVNPKLPER